MNEIRFFISTAVLISYLTLRIHKMIPIYKRATEPEILEKLNLSVNGGSWNAWV